MYIVHRNIAGRREDVHSADVIFLGLDNWILDIGGLCIMPTEC